MLLKILDSPSVVRIFAEALFEKRSKSYPIFEVIKSRLVRILIFPFSNFNFIFLACSGSNFLCSTISLILSMTGLLLGITPKISNEVGINGDTTFREAKLFKAPRAALLESLNRHQYTKALKLNMDDLRDLVAFPNDRTQSIRPSKKDETFK